VRRRPGEAEATHYATANECSKDELTVRARHDSGPIVVAVDGGEGGRSALEWAAAEASARQCALRIVTTFSGSVGVYTSGPVPMIVGDSDARDNAEVIANRSAAQARDIDSTLQITTHVHEDSLGSAVSREGHDSALIVLGWRPSLSGVGP
jgi:hypothetical protein